ncbi:MAG: glycosyltransferase [Dysgonamonadaceae bacterium]|nr:glycosyltransferase [Dysgonamonadaceae bacterium]
MCIPPVITVLAPAYNAEEYISEAIKSVLNQTFTDFELLIINDGSTDKTEEIILSFEDKRIRYIKNETNLKLIATLNKGIDLARGKYIARMDADDICLPNRFEKQIDFLEKHSDYALCGSWAYLIDSKGKKTGRIKYIDKSKLLKISLLFSCPIVHPSTMLRTDILQQFKYNPKALHTEDFELWLRIMNAGLRIANIPDFLIKYRWHSTNISVENETFQIEKKLELLKPYIENFIGREISKEELDLHSFSFRLYHLGEKKRISNTDLLAEKKWFEFLSHQNKKIKKYNQNDFDAFLWSRWIVCCIATRKILSIFTARLEWYKPNVVFNTIKLLIYK